MNTPDDRRYTAEHEWVAATDTGAVRIGITDYAQDSLGDIVYLQLPDVGTEVGAGEAIGEIESTKSVSDLYAPIAGTVTACNDDASQSPETLNSDPYDTGWLLEIEPAEGDAQAVLAGLLSAEDYQQQTSS